jgi:hypothetical protein
VTGDEPVRVDASRSYRATDETTVEWIVERHPEHASVAIAMRLVVGRDGGAGPVVYSPVLYAAPALGRDDAAALVDLLAGELRRPDWGVA